jgi:hypothetical protein
MCLGQLTSHAPIVKTMRRRAPRSSTLAVPHSFTRLSRVVHEEDERLRVLGEVPERQVLAVALQVVESERVFIEDLQGAPRAAAVLHIRLAITASGGELERVAFGDESRQLRGDRCAPAALLLKLGVGATRPAPLLYRFDSRGERYVGSGMHGANLRYCEKI